MRLATTPSTLNTLDHNLAKSNGGDGFLLERATKNTLTDNRSDNNGRDGIRSGPLALANEFVANNMFENAEHDAHDDNRALNMWLGNHCLTDFPTGTICENPGA